jgi:segregation and condensation protein B
MSDLESQAATWVPPWQRPVSENDTPNGDAQPTTEQAGDPGAGEPGAGSPELARMRAEVDELEESLAAKVPGQRDTGPADDTGPAGAATGGGEQDSGVLADGVSPAAGATGDGAQVADGPGGPVPAARSGEAVRSGEATAAPAENADGGVAPAAVSSAAQNAAAKLAARKSAVKAAREAAQKIQDEAQAALDAEALENIEPARELAPGELVPALEAILMVVDEPVSELTLAQVLGIEPEEVAGALIDMSAGYTREGRGFDLRRAAGGWRFYTRSDYSAYVERFVLDGQQLRLTQASLETLAVVAYKQPVSRSRISAIRGVNCDGVIRTLVTRGMVEECGADPDSGAHLYRTTTLFLEKLGLDSVEQLPPIAPFLPDNLDEVEQV